jgi:fucokinase
MEKKISKTLLLQQQYLDSWNNYKRSVDSINYPYWNYIIITASNNYQAEGYKKQIEERKEFLPKRTKFLVIPDENNEGVGSGGATLTVIRHMKKLEKKLNDLRILVIHSGGLSKRVPQYSILGKLFTPIPRELPDGRSSTLFDEIIISVSTITTKIKEGMVIISSSLLLLFNPLKIEYFNEDATCISFNEKAEIGQYHGVFYSGKDNYVKKCLNKRNIEELQKEGVIDEKGNVDMDTGAIIFSINFIESLFSLIDTDEKYKNIVNNKIRLNLYVDFLMPLAEESTLEDFCKEKTEGEKSEELINIRKKIWEIFQNAKYKLKHKKVTHAQFFNFETTRDIFDLMTKNIDDYRDLGWNNIINSSSIDICAYDSVIAPGSHIDKNVYIESSYIHSDAKINSNVIISSLEIKDEIIPNDVVLHGIKQKNGKYICRIYGIDDNPKEKKLFNKCINELPFGLNDYLWNINIYPECDTMDEAVKSAINIYKISHGEKDGNLEEWKKYNKKSLSSGFNDADIFEINKWNKKIKDLVNLGIIETLIYNKKNIGNVKGLFKGVNELNDEQVKWLEETLKKSDFSKRIRLYHYIGTALNNEDLLMNWHKEVKDCILKEIGDLIKYHDKSKIVKDKHVVELPLRVNWGGGWTDTPPYCLENGGKVLNAAILLNKMKPVIVVFEKISEKKIILISEDLNAKAEFSEIHKLQETGNPYDPFAVPKACLIACGILPKEGGNLNEILTRLGSGFIINSRVRNVPKGSGLGTSSILAAALAKAALEFIGIKPTEQELQGIVLVMEQLMSTGGGWQDQAGGLCNGIKIITSEPSFNQILNVRHLNLSEETKEELNKRFCIIYSGETRLASNILTLVEGRYLGYVEESIKAHLRIKDLAEDMCSALESGNINYFANLLNVHWEYSKMICMGATNKLIEKIFYFIEDLISGRMICGAGGGGFLQIVLQENVTKEMLHNRLKETFPDTEIDVWDCSIIF